VVSTGACHRTHRYDLDAHQSLVQLLKSTPRVEVPLGEQHDGLGTAVPSDGNLPLDAGDAHPIGRHSDEDEVDIRREHLRQTHRIAPGDLRPARRDCAHEREPGCAVAAAEAAGTLDADRLANYRKLRRELDFQARRDDPVAAQEARARWKQVAKASRQLYKERGH
jgi:hypothetical protein